jgi:hypothetical protein
LLCSIAGPDGDYRIQPGNIAPSAPPIILPDLK